MAVLLAFAAALALTPLAALAGRAAGLVDHPGDALKIHARPVPVLGGVAVLVAAFASTGLSGDWPDAGVVAAALLVLAGGVLDDRRPLPMGLRLQIQVGAALILALATFEPSIAGALGLVVLVVATTNAVNIVDGQDGLAGGLAAIAALGLAPMLGGAEQTLALAVAGALGGFLVWNRPPARIFLGNGGAYAVGMLLAVLVGMVVAEEGAAAIPAVLLCLGVFLFDLLFTVIRRLGSRKLAVGDRLHSYDLLSVEMGSRGRATLAFWALGAFAAAAGVAVESMSTGPALLVTAAIAAAAALWGRHLWVRRVAARSRWSPSDDVPGASRRGHEERRADSGAALEAVRERHLRRAGTDSMRR